MTKKYVYFVSYVLIRDGFNQFSNREITLSKKINYIHDIHRIEEEHLNVLNNNTALIFSNMTITNFILLREEPSNETE